MTSCNINLTQILHLLHIFIKVSRTENIWEMIFAYFIDVECFSRRFLTWHVCFSSFSTRRSPELFSLLETNCQKFVWVKSSSKSSKVSSLMTRISNQRIFQGFLTARSHQRYFETIRSPTLIHFICIYAFRSTQTYPTFRVIVIATVSVKHQGVGLVCVPQQDAEIPSSRVVAANRSASRGQTPRHETGSSNSPPVAVHLSGSAPSYVKPDSSWCLDFSENLWLICVWLKITTSLG